MTELVGTGARNQKKRVGSSYTSTKPEAHTLKIKDPHRPLIQNLKAKQLRKETKPIENGRAERAA